MGEQAIEIDTRSSELGRSYAFFSDFARVQTGDRVRKSMSRTYMRF